MMKKFYVFYLFIFTLVTLSSGCAFGTRKLDLQYEVTTQPGTPKNIDIHVSDFKDERTEKDVVGHVRNGYGMKTAKIIAQKEVTGWIKEALKLELKNIGYNVVEAETAPINVRGEVITVYVTSMMMYEGKVVLEVNVDVSGQEIYTQKYEGTDESVSFAMTAKGYANTLKKALQKALKEVVHDIDRTITKEFKNDEERI